MGLLILTYARSVDKFEYRYPDCHHRYILKVLGISTKKVYITSGRDDTLKGDTNGDGEVSNPSWGEW